MSEGRGGCGQLCLPRHFSWQQHPWAPLRGQNHPSILSHLPSPGTASPLLWRTYRAVRGGDGGGLAGATLEWEAQAREAAEGRGGLRQASRGRKQQVCASSAGMFPTEHPALALMVSLPPHQVCHSSEASGNSSLAMSGLCRPEEKVVGKPRVRANEGEEAAGALPSRHPSTHR